MRFFKKFLVRIAVIAVTILCSGSVLAQNYVIKTAFVGEPGLKNLVVGKIFDEDHKVFEDASNVCGIRLTTPIDSILYKFRVKALNIDQLRDTALRECNVIFMIVDFSSPKANLNDVLIKDFYQVQTILGECKTVLIAMNTEASPGIDLKQLDSARAAYGRNNFDYILTSFDEDDEAFRNRLFEVTERMIDWRRLPPSIESNGDIISRLELLRTIESNPGNQPVITLVTQMIREANRRIALELRMDATEEHTERIEGRTAVLERDMSTVKQDVDAVKQDIRELKVSVEDLRRVREEQNRLNEFTQALTELSALFREMSATGAFNSAEAQQVLQRIDAGMSYFDAGVEDDSAGQQRTDAEMRDLRKHMIEMKRSLSEHSAAINELIDYRDETIEMHKAIIADREKWEQDAIKIERFAKTLERDEEHLKAIAEGSDMKFICEQYRQSGYFGRIKLRRLFPCINEFALKNGTGWLEEIFPFLKKR